MDPSETDPAAELARGRGDLAALAERLALSPPVDGFAHHQAERQWWTDQLGAFSQSDTVSVDEALEAIKVMSRWHIAWVAAQPQYASGRELLDLGRQLENLARHIMEPDAHPALADRNELSAIDRIIGELTAVREHLGRVERTGHG